MREGASSYHSHLVLCEAVIQRQVPVSQSLSPVLVSWVTVNGWESQQWSNKTSSG